MDTEDVDDGLPSVDPETYEVDWDEIQNPDPSLQLKSLTNPVHVRLSD